MADVGDSNDPKTSKRTRKSRPPLRVVGPDEVDQRIEIRLGPDVHLTTEAMSASLRETPDVYQRSHELVHVLRHEDEEDTRFAPGTPLIRSAPCSWVGDQISSVARCLRPTAEGEWKHVRPPVDRVRAVCEAGEWRGVPHLVGVVEAPTMRPDGTVVQEPGYDAATRVIYSPNADYPRVADEPSESDAVVAYAHIADVFRDFPYVDPSHRAATIAALVTLLVRFSITGSVPCWVFDAASKRSGKSLQMDVVHIIAMGRPCSRMTFPADDDKELESVLASYALAGARVVPFDNVSRPFGGAPLDKCVTAVDSVDVRVLGASDLRTLPWRAVIMASGNNVEFLGDMLPRVLSPRLESPLENPELLEARDLKAFAGANRASLVSDALTIVRAYVVAGRPGQGIRWGGFDAWASLVPSALVWAGAPNPMGARRGLDGDADPTRGAELSLLAGLQRLLDASGPLTAGQLVRALYPAPRADEPPDGHEALREAIEELVRGKQGVSPTGSALGYALRRVKGRPMGGRRLESYPAHGGVAVWIVRKCS